MWNQPHPQQPQQQYNIPFQPQQPPQPPYGQDASAQAQYGGPQYAAPPSVNSVCFGFLYLCGISRVIQ